MENANEYSANEPNEEESDFELEFDETTQKIADIKQFTSWNTFSKQQKWVICCLVNEKRKHSDILNEWNRTIANKLYPSAMITILRYQQWDLNGKKGSIMVVHLICVTRI